jgi:hypothetical protein
MNWNSLGNDFVGLTGSPAAINYGANGAYENVFVTGADGHLHQAAFTPAGAIDPQWNDLNHPTAFDVPGHPAAFASNLVVINYGGDGAYENVFVTGTDGSLYVDSFNPGNPKPWNWMSLGNAGVGLTGSPVAINYGANGAYENVFVTGTDGNLHQAYFTPGTGWNWRNILANTNSGLGNPGMGLPGFGLTGSPAAINYGANENVFVTDANGNLYQAAFTPGAIAPQWNSLGHPGAAFASNLVVINYNGDSANENVFVTGADGSVYQDSFIPGIPGIPGSSGGWSGWNNLPNGGFPV